LRKKNRWRAGKGIGACEKTDGTRENAVGVSEKCRILCKNLQKLSKNAKFHKSCKKTIFFEPKLRWLAMKSLARANDRWRAPMRWRAPTRFAPTAYSVFCTGAPTAYLLLTVFFACANGL
jgi:hypothetical protein